MFERVDALRDVAQGGAAIGLVATHRLVESTFRLGREVELGERTAAAVSTVALALPYNGFRLVAGERGRFAAAMALTGIKPPQPLQETAAENGHA